MANKLFGWLTGAANRSAANGRKGGQQKKKKKKKERTVQASKPKANPKPSKKESAQTNTQKATKPKSSGFQPKTFKTSQQNAKAQYQSFQNSSFKPKTFKPSTQNTSLSSAKKAFEAGQKARTQQSKNKVVTTQAKKPKSKVITDLSKPKNYNYKKDLQKAYKTGSKTTALGTKQKKTKTKVGKSTLESVNALTRSEMNRVEAASRYGKKQGNVLLKGGTRTGQKDIREKVGSKTAESAYKSKFATGVMQGMSKADIFSNSVGTYNKEAKKAIKKTKDSVAYNIGYGVGLAADMGMGGIASRGASAADMAGKGAAKLLGKGASKQIPKKVAKEAAEEYAKVSGKQGAKRFAKNRAGELVAETPSNVLDAAKMSMDTDGNLDKKEFKKWLAINSGATLGVGGAIEGIGAGATKKLANDTIELLGKRESGRITADEIAKLETNIKKLSKKSKADIKTISSDIAEARMTSINAKSAKNAKEVAEAEAQNVPKGFHGRGNRYTQSTQGKAAKARADYAEKLKANDNRMAERAAEKGKVNASKRYQSGIAKTMESGYEQQRVVLQDRLNTLQEALASLKAKEVGSDTMLHHSKVIAEKKLVEQQIESTKAMLKQAEKGTYSGRVKQNLKDLKTKGTMAGHEKAAREREALIAEGKARADEAFKKLDNIAKKAEEKARINPTEQNIATADVTREAAEKAKSEAKAKATPRADLPEQKAYDQANEKVAEIEKRIEDAKKQAEQLDYQAGTKYNQARSKYSIDSPDANTTYKGYKETTALRDQITDVEIPKLEKELEKAQKEAETAKRDLDKAKEPEGGYASFEGESAKRELEVANLGYGSKEAVPEVVAKTAKEAKEGADEVMAVPDKVGPGGHVDATTNVHKKPLSLKFREMVTDNFASLEDIANRLPDGKRKALLAAINEVRRASKTGRSLVAEKGRAIYSDLGLTKRGKATALKRNELEEYCYLKHELDRKVTEKNFTDMSRDDINRRLKEIEEKYIRCDRDKNGDIIRDSNGFTRLIDKEGKYNGYRANFETGQIIDSNGVLLEKMPKDVMVSDAHIFQERMVGYFRELLDREVDARILTKEEANDFIKQYPNYVPTYREKDFSKILKQNTKDEINVGRGLKAAVGGSEDPLVPLYSQMQTKTNAVLKRTELNKMLNLLCEASGTSKEELDTMIPWFKNMDENQKTQALMDAQIFTREEKGQKLAIMYRDGAPIKVDIDKEVYDAIRRWSGEDRASMTAVRLILDKVVDNKGIEFLSRNFKKWITDYNLIFGVKNLKRDLATALFYTTDVKGFVKNMPKGFAIALLPDSAGRKVMKNWDLYKSAYNAYKENGGVISQFIARDSASDSFFDPINKANPFKWVENFNSAMETIPRMTEFISAIDSKAAKMAGKDGNYDEAFRKILKDRDSISDAMYRAKDVTLNFDRNGWLGAKLNRGVIPFFNPAAQGMSKLYRVTIRDNIKYGENFKLDAGGTMTSFLKMGTYLTCMVGLPAVAWNAAFADQINGNAKGYEKQSDYNRYANYLLPIGDGKFIKIPKARELASLQASIDWAWDNIKFGSGSTWDRLFSDGSERDLLSMLNIAKEQTGPLTPWSDSLFMPVYNTIHNKTWYGGKIESGADDLAHREAGEYSKIWDEKTSATAKWIGEKFNMSPKKVDYVLDSYLGLWYDMGISQTAAKNDFRQVAKEEGLPKGIAQLTRTPWGNAFIIDSVFQNANKSDYYDYNDKQQKKLDKLEEGSDDYNKLKAKMTKTKVAFSYTSSQYDELQAQIWLDDKLTMRQKQKYVKMLKKGDNLLWNERKDGKVIPSKDPMAVVWNMKDGDGKHIMSTDTIIDACSFTFKKSGINTIKDAWKLYGKNGGKSAKKFMEVTLAARDAQRVAGDSLSTPNWGTVAYANQLNHIKGSDKVMASYIEDDTKRANYMGNAKVYEEYGGSKKTFYTEKRAITQGAYKLGYDYPSQMRDGELTMILATQRTKKGAKYRDLAYQANGTYILDHRMNAGRCLDERLKSKYDEKKLKKFCDKYELSPSEGKKWTDEDLEKVAKAIDKEYPNDDSELKAAKFVVVTGRDWDNPFGEIGDYSIDSDTGVYCVDAWKGRGRRRWRRRRWHRWGYGGGGGRSSFTPEANTAGKSAKNTAKLSDLSKTKDAKITNVGKASNTKQTFKSNLNDAYRKKVKKLREETRQYK